MPPRAQRLTTAKHIHMPNEPVALPRSARAAPASVPGLNVVPPTSTRPPPVDGRPSPKIGRLPARANVVINLPKAATACSPRQKTHPDAAARKFVTPDCRRRGQVFQVPTTVVFTAD